MSPKTRKAVRTIRKPRMIQVGSHLINPNDIACISRVKRGLYIVKRLSEPNPTFPIWVRGEAELKALLDEFDIKVNEIDDEDDRSDPFFFNEK